MIQRFLYQVLDNGLDAITADPSLLDDIFAQYDLPESEISAIKTWFVAKPPHPKHQYARVDDEFPLCAVVMAGERESDLFIGNDGILAAHDGSGFVDYDDPDFGADLKSSIWQSSYEIHCVTEHPEATAYLYEIVKAIFLVANLDECGLHTTQFSGTDLSPSMAYLPSHLFGRVFSIQGKSEFERIARDNLQKAFRLRGVHIDRGGSPSDPEVEKTLVTIVAGEE